MSWLVQDAQSRHAQAHRTAEAIHSAHAHLRVTYAATAAIAEICLIFATRPGRCAATSAMWGIRRLQKFLRLRPGPRQGACSSLLGGEACVLSCNLIQLKGGSYEDKNVHRLFALFSADGRHCLPATGNYRKREDLRGCSRKDSPHRH